MEQNKKAIAIVAVHDNNPAEFEGRPEKPFIIEYKEMKAQERALAVEIKEYQEKIEKDMMDFSTRMMKLKGAVDYVADKIVKFHKSVEPVQGEL